MAKSLTAMYMLDVDNDSFDSSLLTSQNIPNPISNSNFEKQNFKVFTSVGIINSDSIAEKSKEKLI